jgi:hypothetical protein
MRSSSEKASGHGNWLGWLLYSVLLPVPGEERHASPARSKPSIISSIKELIRPPCYENRNSHASDLELLHFR